MSYQASLKVRCWKQHRCIGCGCAFRYQLARKVSADGSTREAAMSNLERKVVATLTREVDYVPCPECGVVQPDMVASRRTRRAWAAWAGALLVLAALVLAGFKGLTIRNSAFFAAIGVVWSTMCLLLAHSWNPNRQPQQNRARTLPLLKQGLMEVEESSGSTSFVEYNGTTPATRGWLMTGLALAALPAVLAPVLLQTLGDWPLNDQWYPAVVGSGDTSRYYMQARLQSLKGLWRGAASAKIAGPPLAGGAVPSLTVATKKSSWGNQITGKSLSNTSNRLWVDLQVPEDERLAGQTLDLDLDVAVQFPMKVGNGFQDDVREFHERAQLQVAAAAHAGRLFFRAWLAGQLAGLGMLSLAILGVAKINQALAGQALQPDILPLGFD